MVTRNITAEDWPILISVFGKDYVDANKDEISLEKSIIFFNAENKVDVVILMKKSSLFDFFEGVIPEDCLYHDNAVADWAASYENNHYEIINWYVTDDDYWLLNSIYRQSHSINHSVLPWTRCKEFGTFPIWGFYNFNDEVLIDISDD